jgi:hypothetical protein
MKSRLAALIVLGTVAQSAIAGRAQVPVSAPTLSEWALLGLGLIVAVAAGITINRRK